MIRLGAGRYVFRFPARAKVFDLLRNFQNGSEDYLASYPAGIEDLSPGLKQQSDATDLYLVPILRMHIATALLKHQSDTTDLYLVPILRMHIATAVLPRRSS